MAETSDAARCQLAQRVIDLTSDLEGMELSATRLKNLELVNYSPSGLYQQLIQKHLLTEANLGWQTWLSQHLLGAQKGEGLYFARDVHVPMQVVASPLEHRLATTNPKEVAAILAEEEVEAP